MSSDSNDFNIVDENGEVVDTFSAEFTSKLVLSTIEEDASKILKAFVPKMNSFAKKGNGSTAYHSVNGYGGVYPKNIQTVELVREKIKEKGYRVSKVYYNQMYTFNIYFTEDEYKLHNQ